VRPVQLKGKYVQLRDKDNGIPLHLYQGRYQVDFVNIESPEDYCRTVIEGHACDTDDKSPGKAISYAVKYAMLKTFSLETGEDDESRGYEAPAFTDIQEAEFNRILDADNALQYAVFSRKVGPEVMKGLQKTFPDGKISQNKALCKRLDKEGWDILRDYATQIKESVDREDNHGLMQLVGELSDDEKRVLAGILRPEDITAINKAKDL
jgi:hypothetical protein